MKVHTELQPLLAGHPGLLHRMRFLDMRFDVRSSDEHVHVHVAEGRASATLAGQGGGAAYPVAFTIAASGDAWFSFAEPDPRPGYHDLIAMIEAKHATFTGDGLSFFRNLFLVRAIVSALFRGDPKW